MLHKVAGVLSCALPEHVSDTIITGDISIARLTLDYLSHTCLDGVLVLSESQENRTHIGTLDVCEHCPVLLLLGQGVLVALDALRLIVVDAG